MFWQDDEDENQNPDSGEVVDVIFRLQGKTLPVDYNFGLYRALLQHAPWLEDSGQPGLNLIFSAEEGNGWERQSNPDEVIYLSRRTRLVLRLNKQHLPLAETLCETSLDLNGHTLFIKSSDVQNLSQITTMYARHVALSASDEESFLQQSLAELKQLGIRCKKILCGKTRSIKTESGTIETRSLMLDDLSREDVITLQQAGIGPYRALGCGFFVPHKSIK